MRRWLIATLIFLGSVTAALAAALPVIFLYLPPELPLPVGAIPNFRVFLHMTNPADMAGKIGWIWGANPEPPGQVGGPLPGQQNYFYWPEWRSGPDVNRTILSCVGCIAGPTTSIYWDWWLANQPSMVEYQCDGKTLATTTPLNVPLNITDPRVLAYVETGAGTGGLQTGLLGVLQATFGGTKYAGIAIDNVSYENGFYNCGHYAGAVPGPNCNEVTPDCGGTFTQDFCLGNQIPTKPYCSNDTDPAWLNAQIAFTAALHHWINNEGATVVCNNETPGVVSDVYALTVCGDIILAEDAFIDDGSLGGCTGGADPLFNTIGHAWIPKFQYLQLILPNFPMAVGDYVCAGYNAATVPANQVAWGTANFLLDRGTLAWYSIAVESINDDWVDYPSSFTPPCGSGAWSGPSPIFAHRLGTGVYERQLPLGGDDPSGTFPCQVDVNPNDQGSGINLTYTVPAGTWEDQFGNPVASGAQTLAAASGIVLIRTAPP